MEQCVIVDSCGILQRVTAPTVEKVANCSKLSPAGTVPIAARELRDLKPALAARMAYCIAGLQLCFGQPVDVEILTLLKIEIDEVREAVQTWMLKKNQITTLLSNISEIQSTLNEEIDDLRMRVKNCEIQGANNTLKIEECEIQGANNTLKIGKCEIQGANNTLEIEKYKTRIERYSEVIKLLEQKCTTELSRCYIKEEEKIPYVFTAPQRNRYFAGRIKEIQELKRILKVEETSKEKKVRVAAVCGLGGIGKTSLASEYAHQMKDFYQGGVYWFSAEDDTFLEKTVNDVALKIDALLGSFDLTLSNTLKQISRSHDPCLIVLDCLDQLDLSSNMIKFLSFPAQENILGHFVVLTRRNPKLLVNEVSVFEKDSFLQLKCFLSKEAKEFLSSRTGVDLDENVESIAECLCEELGRLPLALEQAGACIDTLSCTLSSYLEQYKTERLRLLSQQQGRPVSPGKESSERLAVHTTWLINMEYMKKRSNGHAAIRFMNASSFFNGSEIEKELVNVGTPEVEDVAYRECVSSPLGCRQVLKLLTDFSLFTHVQPHSVSTHRLVQELVRESLNPESKAESFIDAGRILSYAFSKCSSPNNLVSLDETIDEEQDISSSDLPSSPSHFYMWSKFCMHGHHLCRTMEDLLVTLDSVYLDPVWFPATAKILYECAVHMSANYRQEEAQRLLNFGYRILDWVPVAEYETVKCSVSNNSLFPLSIPLSKSIQIVVKRCCMPPFASLAPLTEKPGSDASCLHVNDLEEKLEKLKLDGNKSFKKGRYKEALDVYSSAIDMAQECNTAFNPLLLTNRATVYLKLGQYEDALKDANDYITRRPDCWRGYARKALALDGLNEKVSAEIAASLAFYHNRAIFSDFSPFKESFFDLQKHIFVCDTVDQLISNAERSQKVEANLLTILVLGSKDYFLNSDLVDPGIVLSNCILVGARINCSVVLKFGGHTNVYLLNKCMITNVSFYFEEGQVCGRRGSLVKILNCNFSGKDNNKNAPIVASEGEFNAESCNFINGNYAGLGCFGPGNMVVVDCSFCNNGHFGLLVFNGGTLIVKSSRMYNNRVHGCQIGPEASKCVVVNCDIRHNDEDGILVERSKNVRIMRNNIFGNNEFGLEMVSSEVDIKENNIFDNGWWGIWSMSNSWCNVSMNRVFRNKAGGVRVGYRVAGKEFSPSVVELNKIYDNIGPGFLDNVNKCEMDGRPSANVDLRKSYLKSPNSLQSAKCLDNEVHNNKESENVRQLNFAVPYCSNCRKKCEPKRCGKCFTAVYCNKACLEGHWSKHKKLCKVLRGKASCLITSMKRVGGDGMIKHHAKSLEEIGPKFSPPPSRDGKRFIVKVQSSVPRTYLKPHTLLLYDRSLELYEEIQSKVIAKLVQEFGIQCERQAVEKKLFLHCLFEENGQLRLFSNEFADFLKW
ncbi:Stress-induced-phospho 1 [Paramuricea clavata]|uniref:Stress-induced-phospho 1 n=1 Tax=Paramuricea clavata TaxID=317549 RepID=A0A6S7HWS0_PARCT|nr:Stress-induced-phospho 1 [Paramuricea clavata]